MKIIKNNWQKLVFTLSSFLMPVISFAEDCVPGGGKICNPIHTNTINDFIKTVLEGALRIGIPVVALAVIYSGFLFVAARGNSEKLTRAKDALLYTLIGAAILLGAWSISLLISSTINSL